MNKDRRKRIEEINRKLAELQNEVSQIIMEEQAAYNNLPTALLASDHAKEMQKDIDRLNWMFDYIYDAQRTFVTPLTFYPQTACVS